MAKSQDNSVQIQETVEQGTATPITEQENTVAEQGKRGRNPLTHADVMARISAPNPVDYSFQTFTENKFGATRGIVEKYGVPDEFVAAVAHAVVIGGVLGRWSTVRSWWNDSDEQKVAKDQVIAWQAEQELNTKLAKLDAAQKAVYDSADEATKSLILSLMG